MVLCHELPRDPGAAEAIGRTYPPLADRLAQECGRRVIAPSLRGAGASEGEFSASGWLEDLAFLCDHEVGESVEVCLIGFGLGGALALRLAATRGNVVAVGTLGAPADIRSWVGDPEVFLRLCRASGVVGSAGFPADVSAWADDLIALDPLGAAAELGRRRVLVVHGAEDTEVPPAAARALAAAADGAGTAVDLRIVPGAGHRLRADPRIVATLIGWVERQE